MQLWELFRFWGFFYCHWQSFKPSEMQPCWLVLYKKRGRNSICQMEKDKTGVMICCNHTGKPTTVNYCCNDLLPVAKGSSPGFLVPLFLTFQFLKVISVTLSTEWQLSFLENKLKSKDGGQEVQVPNFGLSDAAGCEHHQSMVADPQCCGHGFIWHVDLCCESLFLPVCLLVVGISICRSPEVFMALPV